MLVRIKNDGTVESWGHFTHLWERKEDRGTPITTKHSFEIGKITYLAVRFSLTCHSESGPTGERRRKRDAAIGLNARKKPMAGGSENPKS